MPLPTDLFGAALGLAGCDGRLESLKLPFSELAFRSAKALQDGASGHPAVQLAQLEVRHLLFEPRTMRASRAIASSKNLVNEVSLPSADRLLDAIISFGTALTWPEALRRISTLLERGLQRDVEFEKRWPETLGTLLEP
jgi:hypothetical protein